MVTVSAEKRKAIRSLDTRTGQIKEVIKAYPGVAQDQISEIIDYEPGATAALLTSLKQKNEVHRRKSKSPGTGHSAYVYYDGPDPESAHKHRDQTAGEGKATGARRKPATSAKALKAPKRAKAAETVQSAPVSEEVIPGPQMPPITQLPPVSPDTKRRPRKLAVDIASWNRQAKERAERERAEEAERAEQARMEQERAEQAIGTEEEAAANEQFEASHVYVETEGASALSEMPAPASQPKSDERSPRALTPQSSPEIGSAVAALLGAIDELAKSYTEQIAAEISDRIVATMDEHLVMTMRRAITNKVEEKVSSILASNNFEAIAQQAALPRLLIVGLLPDQERMIEKEFDGCFRLRFSKDDPGKSLTDLSANSDYVVTFVKKMSHSEEDSIKAAGKRPIRVSGGMSSLRAALTDLYLEGQKALKTLTANEEAAEASGQTA